MDGTTQPRTRWFHLTPGRFVLALLVVECLLWLSERYGWLGWHKGYAVLTAVAAVGLAMIAMLVWFGLALVFRRRFQFSIGSLLVLVVVVAVSCSWFAAEINEAKEQKAAVEALAAYALFSRHDWEEDLHDGVQSRREPPGSAWLRSLVGDEVFADVVEVASRIGSPEGEGAADYGRILDYLSRLPRLRRLSLLGYDAMTDGGASRCQEPILTDPLSNPHRPAVPIRTRDRTPNGQPAGGQAKKPSGPLTRINIYG